MSGLEGVSLTCAIIFVFSNAGILLAKRHESKAKK